MDLKVGSQWHSRFARNDKLRFFVFPAICIVLLAVAVVFRPTAGSGDVLLIPEIDAIRALESPGDPQSPTLSRLLTEVLSWEFVRPNEHAYLSARVSQAMPVLPQMDSGLVLPQEGVWYAALLVTCKSIERQDEDAEIIGVPTYIKQHNYQMTASVEDAVLIDRFAVIPEQIELRSDLFLADGRIPFEEGKQYLIAATYAYPEPGADALFELFCLNRNRYTEGQNGSGFLYFYPNTDHNGFVPWVEITESFEPTQPSREIDAILDFCGARVNTIPVFATDNVESVLLFQQGMASITEGRAFSSEEAANGSRVCLISRDFAVSNSLSVGDSLSMSLLPTVYGKQTGEEAERYVHFTAKHFGVIDSGEYTVIGVYDRRDTVGFEYDYAPNAIYVPVRSVAERPAWDDTLGMSDQFPPEALSMSVSSSDLPLLEKALDNMDDGWGTLFRIHKPAA